MNSSISDPDSKINMSLDEIIRLTRCEIKTSLKGKRANKRRGKLHKNDDADHSVPLLTSTEGVSIYVSKQSPLLSPDIKQSFLKAVTNRALNAELLKKSTKIIPAKYKLMKTADGVERILVPVKNYVCKPLRKLHQQRHDFNSCKAQTNGIPSLLDISLLKPVSSCFDVSKQKEKSRMEVNVQDDDDDDVVILDCVKKEPQLVDIEMDMSVQEKDQSKSGEVRTLNDRFTRLTGNFQF